MRIAVLNKDKCKYKDCNYLCVRLCPMNKRGGKTVIADSESQNPKPEINEAMCTGCGICANRCPAEAIHIINLPDEIGTPIHQYGKNGFRIFNLPSPKKGVVGIVGKNGIGKSTTLKILSGQIIPNLSNIDREGNWDEVIKYFRGRELQDFLLKISKNELKFSYKPQFVEGIRKLVKGKVRDVIKYDAQNFDAHKRNLLQGLNIDFLDNDVGELSGGELQKLAIYVCLSKDADIYLLDEPSSYLDVEERLNLAKVIGGIQDKFIILVEHDLALLDYLSDYIYVIFGKQGAYGIISNIKSTRIGINEYLDGFLKAENMRFRDSIKFEVIRARNRKFPFLLAKYPSFTKSYEHFRLVVGGGEIYKGQIVGVLGKNASGKTTFIKILAGVEMSDDAKVNVNLKISYKPQYISVMDMKVRQLNLKAELIEKFSIKDLLEKNIDELSGGELQKVAIADCLSKDADIYLLDEPSAYLDVEERLNLAKFLRSFAGEKEKGIFVIDHDILFIDYISDAMIVFERKKAHDSYVEGYASSVLNVRDGMNKFLKSVGITFRREPETGRPRANKLDSVIDRGQKEKGEYYYAD
ncbi:MAG: ribosome biogenesis/translation initiation ATPase RLI [Candidatus Altiarchaeales archaeon HGW-Altiarchaeales-1]|nr:MAG: ribosome biogenesis/translation initiation ATPase RLI [Candidatus Altiarchaeales archaeon HGW-Altiarchaeales-1]